MTITGFGLLYIPIPASIPNLYIPWTYKTFIFLSLSQQKIPIELNLAYIFLIFSTPLIGTGYVECMISLELAFNTPAPLPQLYNICLLLNIPKAKEQFSPVAIS